MNATDIFIEQVLIGSLAQSERPPALPRKVWFSSWTVTSGSANSHP